MAASKKKGTAGTPYEIVRLESWDELIQKIADSPYSNWAFRGQANQAWPLESTLARYFRSFRVHRSAWAEQEERIQRIFKRKAHHFLTVPPAPDDEFQWLALMQHHGAPTRLLDFTWSPYFAAFFALERATGEAAIWALNPVAINEVATQRTGTADMNPRSAGNLRRYFLTGEFPVLWVNEPQVMNRRLIAQLGTFAIPGLLTRTMDEILSAYPQPKKMLVKFVLPAGKVRQRALRELYRMNITHERLFPDLDGLARSLAYELEFHWQFDPHTMERYSDS
jgi:hypothetical protein